MKFYLFLRKFFQDTLKSRCSTRAAFSDERTSLVMSTFLISNDNVDTEIRVRYRDPCLREE